MSDFDLLKDTPDLTAAIKRDRERIMNETDKQMLSDIRERAQDCPLAQVMNLEETAFAKIDRNTLLVFLDSQALEIERMKKSHDEFLSSIGFGKEL